MNIKFHLDRVFRETEDVVFYDISIPNSNASDLVIHKTAATSPPDDNGNKQFYIHYHQIDNNRVISGERTFELINFNWDNPYQIIHLQRESGALTIPKGTLSSKELSDKPSKETPALANANNGIIKNAT